MGRTQLSNPQPPDVVFVRPTNGDLVSAFHAIADAAERIERSGGDRVAIAFSGPRDRSDVGRFLERAITLQAEMRGKQVVFIN
jgi:hypothetical protein